MKKALLICEDHYNGLGIARSLGISGFYIICILISDDINKKALISYSRFINSIHYVEKDFCKIYNLLMSFQSEKEECFVFPLSDYASLFCDKYYNSIPNCFVVPNARGSIDYYQNKINLSDELYNRGVCVPKHKEINLFREEINSEWNLFPAIIKPIISIEGKKNDIVIVNNLNEMFNAFRKLQELQYSRVMIEEYIHGDTEYMIEVLGASKNGEIIFSPFIKKIREYPIKNGSTSFAKIELNRNDCYLQEIKQFILDINYQGLFDIEYKYANGKVYFIELNFRNGAPAFIFTKMHFNIPLWWCGGTIYFPNKDNKRFMVEHRDMLNMMKRNVNFFVWVFQYLTSIHIFWMWRDCSPCLHYYLRMLKRRK